MVKDVIEINIGSGGRWGGGHNKTLQLLLFACNPALLYAYGTLGTKRKTETHICVYVISCCPIDTRRQRTPRE